MVGKRSHEIYKFLQLTLKYNKIFLFKNQFLGRNSIYMVYDFYLLSTLLLIHSFREMAK